MFNVHVAFSTVQAQSDRDMLFFHVFQFNFFSFLGTPESDMQEHTVVHSMVTHAADLLQAGNDSDFCPCM
jgi:hypothetical protein